MRTPTKALYGCHVVDGIKDPLYHTGQNNKSRTIFFKRLQAKAFIGIMIQEELKSNYIKSILVPFSQIASNF